MSCLNQQPGKAFTGLEEGLAHGHEPSSGQRQRAVGQQRLALIASAAAALLALACLASTIAIGVENQKQHDQIRDLKASLARSTVASSSSGASLLRSTSVSSPSGAEGAVLVDDPKAVVDGYTYGGPLFAGSGYWIRAKDMIYQRSDHEVQAIKNVIYIMGGLSNTTSNMTVLNAVTAYDIISGDMTPKAPMPHPRMRFAAAHYDGKVYVMTGYNVPDGPNVTKLTTLHIYDIATDKWSAGKPSKYARSDACGTSVGGKVYLVGGWDDAWALVDTVEVYDPATGEWALGPKMATPRGDCKCANLDGQVFVVGGYDDAAANFSMKAEALDPVTGTWTRKADMNFPRGDLSLIVQADKLLAIGGEMANPDTGVHEVAMSTVEEYHPLHDVWVMKGPLPEARFRFAAAVASGQVYVLGGHPTCSSSTNNLTDSCTHNGLRSVYTFVDVAHPDLYVMVKS